MKYIEHISYPGHGYIYPLMEQDEPLIEENVAKRLINAFENMRDAYSDIQWAEICSCYPEMENWFEDNFVPKRLKFAIEHCDE